jgi:hypothetical protein
MFLNDARCTEFDTGEPNATGAWRCIVGDACTGGLSSSQVRCEIDP